MADPWEELIKQLTNPWDWVAAGVGAGGGAVITILSHGLDLGSSIGGGALAAVTARKAGAASMQGRVLGKRARGLREQIFEEMKESTSMRNVLADLDREARLWQSKAITNEQFARKLDDLIDEYRRAFRKKNAA